MRHLLKTACTVGLITLATQSFAANTAQTSNTVSPAEKEKIESVIHDYLLNKPEILVQALQILQQRQYQEAEQSAKKTQQMASNFAKSLFQQTNDPVAGNPNGKITVVEFFDYQCPHCVDMAPVVEDIIKSNPNVRIVFKDFPIRGPLSELAARAALAANKQGKYYQFNHALLIANQPISEALIFQIAKNNGLNVDQLKKDMNDNTIKDQLKANIKLAQDLQLFGTPAIFIGKSDANTSSNIKYVPGQMNQKQLQDAIDNAAK